MGIKDCRCRIVGKESSPLHQADLVADLQRLPEIVHDAQHGPSLSAQSPDQPQQFKLVVDVQVGGGLVHEDHRGVLSQHHGKVYLLPLTAGQGAECLLPERFHPGLFHGTLYRLPVLGTGLPGESQIGKPPVHHQ